MSIKNSILATMLRAEITLANFYTHLEDLNTHPGPYPITETMKKKIPILEENISLLIALRERVTAKQEPPKLHPTRTQLLIQVFSERLEKAQLDCQTLYFRCIAGQKAELAEKKETMGSSKPFEFFNKLNTLYSHIQFGIASSSHGLSLGISTKTWETLHQQVKEDIGTQPPTRKRSPPSSQSYLLPAPSVFKKNFEFQQQELAAETRQLTSLMSLFESQKENISKAKPLEQDRDESMWNDLVDLIELGWVEEAIALLDKVTNPDAKDDLLAKTSDHFITRQKDIGKAFEYTLQIKNCDLRDKCLKDILLVLIPTLEKDGALTLAIKILSEFFQPAIKESSLAALCKALMDLEEFDIAIQIANDHSNGHALLALCTTLHNLCIQNLNITDLNILQKAISAHYLLIQKGFSMSKEQYVCHSLLSLKEIALLLSVHQENNLADGVNLYIQLRTESVRTHFPNWSFSRFFDVTAPEQLST